MHRHEVKLNQMDLHTARPPGTSHDQRANFNQFIHKIIITLMGRTELRMQFSIGSVRFSFSVLDPYANCSFILTQIQEGKTYKKKIPKVFCLFLYS